MRSDQKIHSKKFKDNEMKTIYTLALAAGLALGQQEIMVFNERVPPPGPAGAKTFTFINRAGGEVVKGAPYSADSVTETVQTLVDGNRIVRTNKSSFARDSEGRSRHEATIQGLGPVGQTEKPLVTVFIDDPVAKVHYSLDAARKVAMKSKSDASMNFKITTGAATRVEHDVVVERKLVGESGQTSRTIHSEKVIVMSGDANMKKEDLGTRDFEGVSAKGTRMKMTIAAGEAGNERAIEVVTETWYSEQIKATVLTKHSDPRMGETSTRLSSIRLGEPASSLFEPPVDYKIEEISNMRMPMTMGTIHVKEER